MPRIPSKLLLGAFHENPLLVRLLQECRTVEHARNELRWLRESVIAKSSKKPTIRKEHDRSQCHQQWQRKLRKLCTDRGRGKPLQYILGDQPFGDLEILCQKRVLIPRSETESYTFHARDVILNGKEQYKGPLRVLDLCSGTGCISLLLYSLLAPQFSDLTIVGVDDDSHAIELSQKNKRHNIRRGLLPPKAENELFFINADILASAKSKFSSFLHILQSHVHAKDTTRPKWDVLVSNPPYVSPSNLANGTTSRSVRRFEPAHALVPPALESSMWQDLGLSHVAREDIFYPAIMYLGHRVDAKLIIMECGDLEQARRIVAIAEFLKVSLCDAYKRNVYIWDENHRPYDADGGARAVVIERTVA